MQSTEIRKGLNLTKDEKGKKKVYLEVDTDIIPRGTKLISLIV